MLSFTVQLHDLEAQLEEERKMRSSATSGRKKLENDLADLLAQLDLEIKAKEDAMKTSRKSQVCMDVHPVEFLSFFSSVLIQYALFGLTR